MSKFEIKMPKLGESITEGTIVSWSVKVGDMIQEDDVLFEVNTAKVSAEIPSPVAGKVVEILYKEGDTVAVGTVVAIIDLDGEESSGTEPVSEGVVREEADAGQVAANVSETSPSPPKSSSLLSKIFVSFDFFGNGIRYLSHSIGVKLQTQRICSCFLPLPLLLFRINATTL